MENKVAIDDQIQEEKLKVAKIESKIIDLVNHEWFSILLEYINTSIKEYEKDLEGFSAESNKIRYNWHDITRHMLSFLKWLRAHPLSIIMSMYNTSEDKKKRWVLKNLIHRLKMLMGFRRE